MKNNKKVFPTTMQVYYQALKYIFLNLERLPVRNNVKSHKVNFRPDIRNIYFLLDKDFDIMNMYGSQKQLGATVP